MAQADYFLKIDGIAGESLDEKHKGEIELESWSWGATNSGSSGHGSGAGSGKVSMQDFHFVMKINKASPLLMAACSGGDHIKACTFTARKAGGTQQEFLKITFTDVLISSYQTGGSNGSTDIIEQISFNFSKIEQEYKEQKADGSLGGVFKKGYDIKANKKV